MICSGYAQHHAGQPLIWWPARVNKHAWLHRVLGCLSQGLSTHDMTLHLDLASAPWPGYLWCPLSHLLLGTRWMGIEAEAITIVASFGCQPCWKTGCQLGLRTWRQEAPCITALPHSVTVPADHEQAGKRKSSKRISLKGIFHIFCWLTS